MNKARIAEALAVCTALAAAFLAGPATAAAPGEAFDAWLARTTDLTAAQIVTVGAENVYSLEPLGAPRPSGEVMALVRTEPLDESWGAAHGFQSWDADLLIDCRGARMRVVRSARYPQRNRQGTPTAGPPSAQWFTPKADEPAVKLLAAACDPTFAWPLRQTRASATGAAKAAETSGPQQTIIETGDPRARPKTEAALPTGSPPSGAPTDGGEASFALQLARGPSEPGARKVLEKARKTLGPAADGLKYSTAVSQVGAQRRYTVRLEGFSTAAAAQAACETLKAAKQDCLLLTSASRAPAPPVSAGDGEAAGAAGVERNGAAKYFVQVARGPSEAGARKALEQARKTLGPLAEGVEDSTQMSRHGDRRRYTARLDGFSTAAAAEAACKQLADAGQTCFVRPAAGAAAKDTSPSRR